MEKHYLFGKVTKYFHDRGYGFIHGEDGNTYFIHASKLYGEYIDRGYYVFLSCLQMIEAISTQRM